MLNRIDESILRVLLFQGPTTSNKLQVASGYPRATFQRHRNDLFEEGLIQMEGIPSKSKNPRRKYYAHRYSLTDKGKEALIETITETLENIRYFIEHPDILGVIFDEYLTQWFREAAEERAYEEAKYE